MYSTLLSLHFEPNLFDVPLGFSPTFRYQLFTVVRVMSTDFVTCKREFFVILPLVICP